jgi:hypothetical protein
MTKLPNSEQSYKGKVKTHKSINRINQSTTVITVSLEMPVPSQGHYGFFRNACTKSGSLRQSAFIVISVLDIYLKFDMNVNLPTRLYDKRDHFNVAIINCPHLDINIPIASAYRVYTSQLIR